jgi:Kdo2-lipid IVA lauroyltransferase/acyltransferase
MTSWLTGRVLFLLTWGGFTLGRMAVKWLPQDWLLGFADLVARIGFYCFSGFRTRSIKNIAAAFGNRLSDAAVEETARRSLRNFLRSCVELAIALEISEHELRSSIPIVGREHLDAAVAKGSGVLVLSAHLGNFFLVGTRLAIEGFDNSVLINQPRDKRLAKLLDDYRLQVRQKTIHAQPRREALRALHDSLRRNEMTLILSDEYRRGNGVEVPLFGKTAIARRGPATVALRTGAPIVPAYMIRQADGSLKLIIEPELKLDRSGKGAAQIRENVIRMTEWLERTVRRYPDQWNWMNIRSWTTNSASEARVHDPIQQAS